jgi:formylglycine-generating enzyme required for sulfatase activity
MIYVSLLAALVVAALPTPQMKLIPGGTFDMGCHDTLGTDDELPIHSVTLDSFWIGNLTVTNEQYCAYLNSAYHQGTIEVRQGLVYATGDTNVFCETGGAADSGSSILFSGDTFTVRGAASAGSGLRHTATG